MSREPGGPAPVLRTPPPTGCGNRPAGPGKVTEPCPPPPPPPTQPAPPRPAVYFTKLTLRNVRCFGDVEQELKLALPRDGHAGWTVLLGDNGTGKTTVLECLTAAHKFTTEMFGPPRGLGGDSAATADHFEERKQIPWGSRFFADDVLRRTGSSAQPFLLAEMACDSYPQDVKDQLPADDNLEKTVVEWSGGDRFEYGPLQVAFQESFSVVAYAATRSPGTIGGGSSALGSRFVLKVPSDWLRNLDYSAAKTGRDSRFARRLKLASDTIVEVLPGVCDLRFTEPGLDGAPPRVEFNTPDGWVPLDRTAYGYQTLFVWVLDLVARLFEHYPDSDAPLEEPAVVLVDEIELHLHPSWQRDVLRFLDKTFPNVQFVVTTHSPLVAQAAPEVGANLAVLRRETGPDGKLGPVLIDDSAVAVRGWRVDQVLASDLFDTPPETEPVARAMEERRRILRKPHLTPADEAQLTELESALDIIPPGQTREEIRDRTSLSETLDVLRAAVADAKSRGSAVGPAAAPESGAATGAATAASAA